MRTIFAMGLVFSLAGCAAIPPVVTFASWALGGVTYSASGKMVADHAVSSITQEDCAFMRIFKNEPVCHEFAEGEGPVLVAYDGEQIYPDGVEGRMPRAAAPAPKQPEATRLAGDLPELTTAAGPAPAVMNDPVEAPSRTEPISGAASGTELDEAGAVAARVKAVTGSIWASELIGEVWPTTPRTAHTSAPASAPAARETTRAEIAPPASRGPEKPRLMAVQTVSPQITPRPRPRSLAAARAPAPTPAPAPAPAVLQRGMMEFVAPPRPASVPTSARTSARTSALVTKAGDGNVPRSTAGWHFVVIGSFANAHNATDFAAQFQGMRAEILSTVIGGRRKNRVVIGPFRTEDLSSAKLQIRAVGIADAWTMPALGSTWIRSDTGAKSGG